MFLQECAGPERSPTIILLHGWTLSADLNWGVELDGAHNAWLVRPAEFAAGMDEALNIVLGTLFAGRDSDTA